MKAENINDTKKKKNLESLKGDIEEIRKYRADQNPVTISINLANYFSDSLNTQVSDSEKTELKRVQQQYNDGANG